VRNEDVSLSDMQRMQVEELEKLQASFSSDKKIQEDLIPGIFLKEWKRLEPSLSQTRLCLQNTE